MKTDNRQPTAKIKAIDFDEVLAEELKNPRLKRYFDEYGRQLELAHQILKLRQARKMSQAELAGKIGTTQSNVARIEAGNQNFTIRLLDKVAAALGSDLKINLVG